MVSLYADGFHFIRYADGGEELYDVRTDLIETKNLVDAPEHAAQLGKMRKRLRDALKEVR